MSYTIANRKKDKYQYIGALWVFAVCMRFRNTFTYLYTYTHKKVSKWHSTDIFVANNDLSVSMYKMRKRFKTTLF